MGTKRILVFEAMTELETVASGIFEEDGVVEVAFVPLGAFGFFFCANLGQEFCEAVDVVEAAHGGRKI